MSEPQPPWDTQPPPAEQLCPGHWASEVHWAAQDWDRERQTWDALQSALASHGGPFTPPALTHSPPSTAAHKPTLPNFGKDRGTDRPPRARIMEPSGPSGQQRPCRNEDPATARQRRG